MNVIKNGMIYTLLFSLGNASALGEVSLFHKMLRVFNQRVRGVVQSNSGPNMVKAPRTPTEVVVYNPHNTALAVIENVAPVNLHGEAVHYNAFVEGYFLGNMPKKRDWRIKDRTIVKCPNFYPKPYRPVIMPSSKSIKKSVINSIEKGSQKLRDLSLSTKNYSNIVKQQIVDACKEKNLQLGNATAQLLLKTASELENLSKRVSQTSLIYKELLKRNSKIIMYGEEQAEPTVQEFCQEFIKGVEKELVQKLEVLNAKSEPVVPTVTQSLKKSMAPYREKLAHTISEFKNSLHVLVHGPEPVEPTVQEFCQEFIKGAKTEGKIVIKTILFGNK